MLNYALADWESESEKTLIFTAPGYPVISEVANYFGRGRGDSPSESEEPTLSKRLFEFKRRV